MNKDQVQSVVRYVVKASGGGLVAAGYFTSSGWDTIAGAFALIVGAVWAHYHHAAPDTAVPINHDPPNPWPRS